jgi:hypothetical protein
MQYLPALCLALVALIATGCSSDPEDRKFFGSGWMKPESGADSRIEDPQSLVPIQNEYDHPAKQAPPPAAQPAPQSQADR